MKITTSPIPDVLLIEPRLFTDERGFFFESWRADHFAAAGIALPWVQDNQSRSRQGTLRGLHYQLPQAQGKLVRVTQGEIFDVAVDLRRQSPTFGQWVGYTLSADNHRMLWIPPQFAHGLYVTSTTADVVYKCTDYYAPACEQTIRWDDPDLAIDWPLVGRAAPLVSDKDSAGRSLAEAPCFP